MQEYPLKRELLWTGVGCSAFFLSFGVFSVGAALLDMDKPFPQPLLAAAVFGGFWGGMASLSLFLVVEYRRTRLLVSTDHVGLVGVFRSKAMTYDEIVKARWRKFPAGGSLVLRDGRQRIVVSFHDYPKGDRPRLVEHFRRQIPLAAQENWEAYQDSSSPKPLDYRKAALVYIALTLFLLGFGAFFLTASMLGRIDARVYLPLAAVNFVAAAWGVRRAIQLRRQASIVTTDSKPASA